MLAVLTRAKEDNKKMREGLSKMGVRTYEFPTIKIIKRILNKEEKKILGNLRHFDYIIFTSAHTVKFFVPFKQKVGKTKIIAVGDETKKALSKIGLNSKIVSSKFTSTDLLKKFKNAKGKKIFIPSSDIASKDLPEGLRKKGAVVKVILLYKNQPVTKKDKKFNDLLRKGGIDYLTFMSSSAVRGFKRRLNNSKLFAVAKGIPALSIGPSTAGELKKEGFTSIKIANKHTTEGIIKLIK